MSEPAPAALRALSEALRKACPPRAWSRGVILARDGAVEGRSAREDELELAVRAPERPVPFAVVLYLETLEWDCDCDAPAAACAHAAAAVIALAQAREAGSAMPEPARASARLRYAFRRDGARLSLRRLLVTPDGQASVFAGEAARRAAQVHQGAQLAVEEVDLRIEPLVAAGEVEVTHPEQIQKLLELLEDAREVTLDDQPVKVSRRPIPPRGRVEADSRGATFSIERDPTIEAVVTAGVALAQGTLRPLGEIALGGARLEKLPIRRKFSRESLAELLLEVLPLYRARFEIDISGPLPPVIGQGQPRLELGVELGHDEVTATPALVYGRPTSLRIETGRGTGSETLARRPVYIQGSIPERDHAAEVALINQLRAELNLVVGRRVAVRGSEAPVFFRKLRAFQEEHGGPDAERAPRLVPRMVAGARPEVVFAVAIDRSERGGEPGESSHAAPGGTRTADPLQVLAAFESGHELVPLLGGGWAELPRDFLEKHAADLALLLSMRDREGPIPPFSLPALGRIAEALDAPPPPELARLAPLFSAFEGLPEAPLPGDLSATLRPYQRRGVDWLCFLRDSGLGAVLADDMGLGKTLQALCAIRGRTLIACPTSVLPNWTAELRRFRPSLRVVLYHGPGRSLDPEADVTLTTHTLLRNDEEALGKISWETFVLDEAQGIKNADSQTARAAFALSAKWKVALTGTPIENRLEELWSQLHLTNPGLLHGRAEFTERFARPIARGDAEAAARLKDRIRPVILRRKKSEVARDLPPRTEMVLFSELDPDERGLYESIRLATRKDVVERLAQGASVLAVLEALLRLRQAACHPGLLPGRSAATSSKLETLAESLEEVVSEGHKALIFSQWTSLLDLLERRLEVAGLPFVRLDGSTRDRGAVVQTFQSPGGPPLMIISLKAGGTGLNLTAADHVFLLDPWWNPAVENQAADRAHRIGQERPVMVYRLVSRDTVEERVLDLQGRKRALAELALDDAAAAAALGRDDLLALLD